jgi:predicted ATPase
MPRTPQKTLRFTNLYLENWRNFSKVDIDLQRRVFLVGPNASGKSNFLDVFRFLQSIVSVGGGFQEAVRTRGSVSSLRCLAARQYSDIVIKVQIGNESNANLWSYYLKFNQDRQRAQVIREEKVEENGVIIINRPDEGDKSDRFRLSQTYLEQVQANKNFREVADFLLTARYLHIVPQLVREPDRSVGKKNDPYGGDFLEQIAGTRKDTQESRLRLICDALRIAVPQLSELKIGRDQRGTPHLLGRYLNWRPHGQWQNEERFSDGTLRLLGLLWVALDGSGPLLLEEPELSLHPEVVRVIPQMFARLQRKTGRQILISTHSPDLLQDKGIGLDELLVLMPDQEGSTVKAASAIDGIKLLMEGAASPADILIPYTKPKDVGQLMLKLG